MRNRLARYRAPLFSVAALGGVGLAALAAPSLLRVALALAVVLALPGSLFVASLTPAHDLTFTEKVLLSLGLSLAIIVVSGLVLEQLPWGLQARSWIGTLGGIALIGMVLISLRRPRVRMVGVRSFDSRLPTRQVALLSLSIIVACIAFRLATNATPGIATHAFTQLWMIPEGDAAVRLGVSSGEAKATQYRLQVLLGDTVLGEWAIIELRPGEKWEIQLALPSRASRMTSAEALLYDVNAPGAVYRRVTIESWP